MGFLVCLEQKSPFNAELVHCTFLCLRLLMFAHFLTSILSRDPGFIGSKANGIFYAVFKLFALFVS